MAEIGMSFSDYTLLATLHREPAPHRLAVSRLSELVLKPMGSITQVVDRIESAGLVTRHPDPDDRRRILVQLTAEGLDRAERGDGAYRASRERVLAQLEPEELTAIDEGISELLTALEADRVRSS